MTSEKHFTIKDASELLLVDSLVRADSHNDAHGNKVRHKAHSIPTHLPTHLNMSKIDGSLP